jgi:hypothetical protein
VGAVGARNAFGRVRVQNGYSLSLAPFFHFVERSDDVVQSVFIVQNGYAYLNVLGVGLSLRNSI